MDVGQVDDVWAVKLRRIRQIITRTKYGEIISLARHHKPGNTENAVCNTPCTSMLCDQGFY